MGFTIPADAELALRLGIFLAVFAALALWEWRAPARAPRLSRALRWRANLGLAVLNTLVLRVVLPGSALAFAALAAEEGWGLLNRYAVPEWAAVAAGIVLLDLLIYFQHVLFHSVPALARLHAVHHADPDFDLTTGIRFHPLEIVLSTAIKFGAIAALGAPVLAVLAFEILLNATAMFNHANVSLPAWLEPWVRGVLVTPDMHRTHHSVIEAERNSNYGFCLSVWDRLLGTYTPAPSGRLVIGLAAWRETAAIATLPGVLRMPFRRGGEAMKTLFILNDPPYGTERSYNGLRLARELLKDGAAERQVLVFLLGMPLPARAGQKVPQGYYNLADMLGGVLRRGGEVAVCGTCMDARGLAEGELVQGARRGTMEQLARWTAEADKVLVF